MHKAAPAKEAAPAKKAAGAAKQTPVTPAPVEVVPAAAASPAAPAQEISATTTVAAPPAAPADTAPKTPANRQPLAVPAQPTPAAVVEDPWTEAELAAISAELEAEIDRLRGEIETAETDLADRLRDGGDGAGDDQADAGTKTFEREHEMSIANNARDLLVQTQHALARIEGGTYGRCENCGNPIGKLRLQANPRATLCVSCKQREERR